MDSKTPDLSPVKDRGPCGPCKWAPCRLFRWVCSPTSKISPPKWITCKPETHTVGAFLLKSFLSIVSCFLFVGLATLVILKDLWDSLWCGISGHRWRQTRIDLVEEESSFEEVSWLITEKCAKCQETRTRISKNREF